MSEVPLIDLMAKMENTSIASFLSEPTGKLEVGYWVSEHDMFNIKKRLRELAQKTLRTA